MTRITAVLNQKGGVGKTTTTHAFVSALATKGAKVLAIDADAQADLTDSMRGVSEAPGVYEAMEEAARVGKDIDPGRLNIQHTENGDLLGSNTNLFDAEKFTTEQFRYELLKDAVTPVIKNYHYIFIDCPPNLGIMTQNALYLADDVIVPISPGRYSFKGLVQLYNTIQRDRRVNPNLHICGLLMTKFDRSKILHRSAVDDIRKFGELYNLRVYNTIIYNTVTVEEAQQERMSIYDYNRKAEVAKNYAAAVAEYSQNK